MFLSQMHTVSFGDESPQRGPPASSARTGSLREGTFGLATNRPLILCQAHLNPWLTDLSIPLVLGHSPETHRHTVAGAQSPSSTPQGGTIPVSLAVRPERGGPHPAESKDARNLKQTQVCFFFFFFLRNNSESLIFFSCCLVFQQLSFS